MIPPVKNYVFDMIGEVVSDVRTFEGPGPQYCQDMLFSFSAGREVPGAVLDFKVGQRTVILPITKEEQVQPVCVMSVPAARQRIERDVSPRGLQ